MKNYEKIYMTINGRNFQVSGSDENTSLKIKTRVLHQRIHGKIPFLRTKKRLEMDRRVLLQNC